MGELGALFNPGMRHELEERQAKAARREEEGNAKDGDLRIDLESGVAVINIPGSGDDRSPTASTEPAPADDAAGGTSTAPKAAAGSDGSNHDDETAELPAVEQVQPVQRAETTESASKSTPAVRPRGKRGMSTSTR